MGIAFARGDRLTLKGWSNATATINALVSIRPIESWGPPVRYAGKPYSVPLETDLASTRAQATVHVVLETDGEIDDAVINYTSASNLMRGQTYTQLLLQRTGTTRAVTSLLTAGYVYGGFTNGGHLPSLNHIDEPGPAGGHGHYRLISGTNPAAGVLPIDAIPTGAIWRLRSYEVPLVTDANAGNRGFALIVDDGTAAQRIYAVNNTNTQAATLTRTWAWFIGTEGTGAAFTDTQVVLPAYNLKFDTILSENPTGGFDNLRLVSTGALAFTATDDFGVPIIEVEEWVMPT